MGQKSKKISPENYQQKNIFLGLLAKKNMPKDSVQVSLTITGQL